MTLRTMPPLDSILRLSTAIATAQTLPEIYDAALAGLREAFGLERASILLFDPDGVLRFKAWTGLSPAYRAAVEGHTPWQAGQSAPEPVIVPDVRLDPSLQRYAEVFDRERIVSMAFVPLVSAGKVIGKLTCYRDRPSTCGHDEISTAMTMGLLVGLAVEQTRAAQEASLKQQRVLFALDAANVGTWEWDLVTNRFEWSENLERIHGRPPGTFSATADPSEDDTHPDDRERVRRSVQRALDEGALHDVEYRAVTADGTVRWLHGKGRVERDPSGRVRMTGVCMDIHGRKEVEAQNARLLEDAQRALALEASLRQQAQDANRVKDEFLATLSHELRTPLNVIQGRARMLRTGVDRQTVQAAEVIERNGQILARLVDDMLDLSRITLGQVRLERHLLHLGAVVEAAVQAVQPTADAKGIVITVDAVPDAPVMGDATRLQQVVWNLLSNAVKFTPVAGHVRVTVAADPEGVALTVADSGEGIPSGFLPYVFDMFTQAERSATRRHGGLGVGLSIVRRLVELHGGQVDVASAGPGQGSTFRVTLPLAGAGLPVALAVQE